MTNSYPSSSPPPPNRSPLSQLFHVTLGLAVTTLVAADAGVRAGRTTSQRVYTAVVQVTQPLWTPLDKLGVTELVAQQLDAIVAQIGTTVEQLETRGAAGAAQSAKLTERSATEVIDAIVRRLHNDSELLALILDQLNWVLPKLGEHPAVRALVRSQVAAILPELADDPAVTQVIQAQVAALLPALASDAGIQQLIRAQVSTYLAYLNEHPDEAQALIRNQGDIYIDYLNAHPTQVQTLLQGQSLSLAGQVRDEIRERTVSADGIVDAIVRNVLRLKPREELAPPPLEVQRRAQSAHLPADNEDGRQNGQI